VLCVLCCVYMYSVVCTCTVLCVLCCMYSVACTVLWVHVQCCVRVGCHMMLNGRSTHKSCAQMQSSRTALRHVKCSFERLKCTTAQLMNSPDCAKFMSFVYAQHTVDLPKTHLNSSTAKVPSKRVGTEHSVSFVMLQIENYCTLLSTRIESPLL